jgi:hypothetical protein
MSPPAAPAQSNGVNWRLFVRLWRVLKYALQDSPQDRCILALAAVACIASSVLYNQIAVPSIANIVTCLLYGPEVAAETCTSAEVWNYMQKAWGYTVVGQSGLLALSHILGERLSISMYERATTRMLDEISHGKALYTIAATPSYVRQKSLATRPP